MITIFINLSLLIRIETNLRMYVEDTKYLSQSKGIWTIDYQSFILINLNIVFNKTILSTVYNM